MIGAQISLQGFIETGTSFFSLLGGSWTELEGRGGLFEMASWPSNLKVIPSQVTDFLFIKLRSELACISFVRIIHLTF